MHRCFLVILIQVMSCGSALCQNIREIWRTDSVFRSPESVLFDQYRNRIYVSNINGRSDARDGNGFLSVLDTNGNILQLRWIEGLHAPKGMAIFSDKLYVTDIDELIAVDLTRSSIVARYKVPGAVFLNDVAVSNNGTVYISDSRANKMYCLNKDTIVLWMQDSSFHKINGLFVHKQYIYVGSEQIQKINRRTGKISVVRQNCGGIDGLVVLGKQTFLFSNWPGRIYYLKKDDQSCILDVQKQGINTADIDYVPSCHLLLIPTFLDNRVIACRLD